MDHVIRISNKTCFSENKKARQYGGEIYIWLYFMLTVLKKKIYWLRWRWGTIFLHSGNLEFIIVFSSQSGQIGIFKRDWKNIYKKNIVYSNQTYCVKISWIVYRMKIEAVVFRIVWRNVLLLFITLIQEYKMVLVFNKATLCIPKVFSS